MENPLKSLPNSQEKKSNNRGEKRAYVSQTELPSRPLRDALRVAQAITDNSAGKPTAPHDIALALEFSPTSSNWRELAAASLGYGLTKGSWNASKIELTELGRRATAPTQEGDNIRAKAEVALRPKKLAAFFTRYNKSKLPQDNIAKNVLQQELGVPPDCLDSALKILKDDGQFVGFIRDTKTGPFVAIDNPQPRPVRMPEEPPDESGPEAEEAERQIPGVVHDALATTS